MRRLVDVRGGVAQTVQRPEGDDVGVQVESSIPFQEDQSERITKVDVGPSTFVEVAFFKQFPEPGFSNVIHQVFIDKVHVDELFKFIGHIAATDFSRFLDVVLLLWFHIRVSVEVYVNLHVRIGPGSGFDSAHTPRSQAGLARHLKERDPFSETDYIKSSKIFVMLK